MLLRRFTLLGASLLGMFLLLFPEEGAANHIDRTVCERQFITLPEQTYDPFGQSYTRELIIPGIGRRRRIAECDYMGGPPSAPSGATGGRGEGEGGGVGDRFGMRDGGLRRGGPRIDYARYIADLLREREERRRRRPEVPRDREEELPVPSLVPSFMEEEPHDSDCDGFTDAEEHFLGSDPHDPLDPYVYEPYRKRTVSLDPRHPCFEGPTQVVMPKTGWERGEWFFPAELAPKESMTFSWMMLATLVSGTTMFLTLLLVLQRSRG